MPCLYYGFYCSFYSKIIYIFATLVLCAASLIVSFFDKVSLKLPTFIISTYHFLSYQVFRIAVSPCSSRCLHRLCLVQHHSSSALVCHSRRSCSSRHDLPKCRLLHPLDGHTLHHRCSVLRFANSRAILSGQVWLLRKFSFILKCILLINNINYYSFTRTPCFTYSCLLLPFLTCVVLRRWLILASSQNIFLNASFKALQLTTKAVFYAWRQSKEAHSSTKLTTFILISSF